MSATQAIGTANILQNKIGMSLGGVTNLLAPPERSDTLLQAGASTLPVPLLAEIKVIQDKTYECVEKVATILQTQLDIAEEKDRREKDQLAELNKEKRTQIVPAGGVTGAGAGGTGVSVDEVEGMSSERMQELLTLGLGTTLLSGTALKTFGAGLGRKLLKGGIYGVIASLVAGPAIDFINDELDLELTQDNKDTLKFGAIGAGVGFGLAGIPGAIVGATAPMIAEVGKYIAGYQNATETGDINFAGMAVGGSVAAMFTASKLGGVLKGSTLPKVATFGAALGSLPVIIGIGAAAAVGVGAMFIAKKVDEYQEMALQKLGETVEKLDREMGEWAASQSEGIFERMGINLGSLSEIGKASVASKEAMEQVGQDKEKFLANEQSQGSLKALATTLMGYNDEALQTILTDSSKATNFLDTLENLKGIAAQGGFGEDSQMIFQNLSAFSDKLQNYAAKLMEEGVKGGKVSAVALNKEGIGGDQLENIQPMFDEIRKLESDKIEKEKQLIDAQKAVDEEKAENPSAGFFIPTEKQKELRKIQNEFDSLENDIERQQKKLNKFKTINGLLFTYEDLEKLYKDDMGALRAIIERSANQSGSAFLEAQAAKPDESKSNIVVQDNSSRVQKVDATMETYVKKLDVNNNDYFYSREAYNFGAI